MNADCPAEPSSFATPTDGAKLFAAPSARNANDIANLVSEVAPKTGRALEIASGTGQHIVVHAARHPGITWQPSDINADRRASIAAYMAEAALPNILPPVSLNAALPCWSDAHGGQDLILLVNLLHLITEADAKTIIRETAAALAPGGRFVLYGPFMRAGELTSDGDAAFHERLQSENPDVGYKDDFDVLEWAEEAWLMPSLVVEMPANNLGFVFAKP